MKRIPPVTMNWPDKEAPKVLDPVISDISVDNLIGKCLLILHREVTNLLMLSAKGKLEANGARDLRDTTKLLFELRDREKDILESMDEDAVKKAAEWNPQSP